MKPGFTIREPGEVRTGSITVIEPPSGWRPMDWKELHEFRDLFRFLVWRSIKVRYAQSAIGVGWAIIQPVFSMLVFTIVFGNLAQIDSEGVPYAIFSFTALVPWTYFSNALTVGTNSLLQNAGMISKVYFPRLILPISAVVAKLVDFSIAMLLLAALMTWFGVVPTQGLLVLPLLILLMMISAAGLGMWLTALAIQYRDVKHAMTFVVQLLMYACPVVYATSLIPEQYQLFYAINPMVGVIEGFRAALLGTRATPAPQGFLGHLIAREYSQEACRNGEARSRCGGGGGSPEGDRRCCRERPWGTVFGPAQARDGAASAARRGS